MNLHYITKDKIHDVHSLSDLYGFLDSSSGGTDEVFYLRSIYQKLFYTIREKSVYFTDSVLNFKNIGGFKFLLDQEKVFFYRNTGLVFAPYTVFSDIYRVPVFSAISIEQDALAFKPIYPSGGEDKIDQKIFEDKIKSIIKTETGKSDETVLLHGGGADSTFLMGLCRELGIDMTVLTCVMTGMEGESALATRISERLGYYNEIHNCKPEKLRQIVDDYIEDKLEVVSDPAMPIITEMLYGKRAESIIDGQGADSLLLSLPFCKLLRLYNKKLSWIYKPVRMVLSYINTSKETSLGRKVYRIKKVINALSQPDIEDCLLSSLGFPDSCSGFEYYKDIKEQFRNVFSFYKDKYKALSYIFIFKILPVRELQKYENIKSRNIQTCLPFLDPQFIDYIFNCKVIELYDGKDVKKPIFRYIENKIPNFIKKNKTHPFFVEYSSNETGIEANLYKGRIYPISDLSNYAFTSYNITKLKEVLSGFGD
ncbi:MAG: hypothetical protein LIO85_10590 [Rikenellaceae bacterium]|nr:hypothetical protein [Rikenellaceae bacterium]